MSKEISFLVVRLVRLGVFASGDRTQISLKKSLLSQLPGMILANIPMSSIIKCASGKT